MDNLQPIGFRETIDPATRELTIEGGIRFDSRIIISPLLHKVTYMSKDVKQATKDKIRREIAYIILAWLKQYAPHELQSEYTRIRNETILELRNEK